MMNSCFVCMLFKRNTEYELRISDWSSDGCSSGLGVDEQGRLDIADGDAGAAAHEVRRPRVHDGGVGVGRGRQALIAARIIVIELNERLVVALVEIIGAAQPHLPVIGRAPV